MRIATITPVWNEKTLLPQYLAHYAPEVDRVFLLDNESDDGCLTATKAWTNISVSTYSSGGMFRDDLKHQAMEAIRGRFGRDFDLVLLLDVDEFVLHKSGLRLRDALEPVAKIRPDYTWTHGFNVFAKPGEADYVPSRAIVRQRKFGIESFTYSKPAIVRPRASISFCPGFHSVINAAKPPLEELRKSPFLLLHFVGIDEAFYIERGLSRAGRMSTQNIESSWAAQYIGVDEHTLQQRFTDNSRSAQLLPHVCGP